VQEIKSTNFYAVIIDYSSPYWIDSINRYACTIKIIDEDINPMNAKSSKPSFLTLTVFSQSLKDIPKPCSVGDIIRVHRSHVKKYLGRFQLNCDCDIQSSWCLFHYTPSNYPMQNSGNTYSFQIIDKIRLEEIRTFSLDYFAKATLENCFISTNHRKDEMDMHGIVLRREGAFPQDRLIIFNLEDFVSMQINKDSFTHLKPRDIIYIRGLKKIKGFYFAEDYTGILVVPDHHLCAISFREKYRRILSLNIDFRKKVLMYLPLEDKEGDIPFVTVSKVNSSLLRNVPLMSIFQINEEFKEHQQFRVQIFVLEIIPKDVNKWLLKSPNKSYFLAKQLS